MTTSDTGPGLALFLDFDGTLVDIAERPDAVRVEPQVAATLETLRSRLDGALAIVTGRTVADLDRYLPGFDACGLHGLERRVAGRLSRPEGLRSLAPEVAALRARFGDRPGIVIEDKGIGLAVHWRLAPEAEEEAAAAAASVAEALGPGYRVQDGKAVREVVAAHAGKGAGIRHLMAGRPYAGRRPIFAGDDRTDEHGFEAVNALGGVSIKVGPGPTVATRRCESPPALREWLRDLARRDAMALDALSAS